MDTGSIVPYEILSNFITGAAATKFLLGSSSSGALQDGVNHGAASLASQVIALEGFVPIPNSLQGVAVDLGNGVWYVVANMVNDKSPFNSKWAQLLYGAGISIVSNNVTSNLLSSTLNAV